MTYIETTQRVSTPVGGYTGRRSSRVEPVSHEVTALAGPGPNSGPEGHAQSAVNSRTAGVPERRAARPKQRQTAERLHLLKGRLSERDLSILQCLQASRYLTTNQLQQLHFDDHASDLTAGRVCRRVLRRLAADGVIEHLRRRIGGIRAGSASFVWRVGLVGDRLLRAERDQPRDRRKEPSLRHLEHCLAIAEAHVTLVRLGRSDQLELVESQPEPASWRSYLGVGGEALTLKPDLYAVTATGEFEDHWFIEIDRATESLPTIVRKCIQYEAYRRTGREQHDHGVFPLVVWITSSDRHADQLRAAIASNHRLDAEHFRVCTPAGFADVVRGGAA